MLHYRQFSNRNPAAGHGQNKQGDQDADCQFDNLTRVGFIHSLAP
ncbi:hypothetical protein JCM19241_6067 [Vibrio ishigakensis]|uniref:Uncharacterized protein n=1 Tax=Vibrio ishigakensis TaxID=1481914 RepID=A0A0B8QI30_9VIBR|nr:hypothetical protein JCM19241_6067 [Vibrio ishigakensis]